MSLFTQIYDNYVLYKNGESQINRKANKTEGYFSISSAGSCYKKQYYILTNTEEEVPSILSLKKMRIGTVMHDEFEQAMLHHMKYDNNNTTVFTEFPVKLEKYMVEGTLDAAILDNNTLHVADWKTMAGYPFKLRFGRERKKNISKVSTNYEMQVCTYAIALADTIQHKGEIIPYLVCYNKDTSKMKTIEIPPQFINEAQFYWEDLGDCLNEMGDDMLNIHPNDNMLGVPNADWECNYCNFKTKCHGE